jgi:DNA-binding response OmpR family regulator
MTDRLCCRCRPYELRDDCCCIARDFSLYKVGSGTRLGGRFRQLKRKLRCIDPDVHNLNIRDIVLRQEGYDTLVAADANSGLRLFGTSDVSLVILDYDLPDLNGRAVACEMRQLKTHIPILMLSAQLFRPDDVDGEVDAYLTKGGSVKEFLEQIEVLLSTKKPVQSEHSDLAARKPA